MFGMESMSERMEEALRSAVGMGEVMSPVADVMLAVGLSVLAYLIFRCFV